MERIKKRIRLKNWVGPADSAPSERGHLGQLALSPQPGESNPSYFQPYLCA